jgi:hypothetical protein
LRAPTGLFVSVSLGLASLVASAAGPVTLTAPFRAEDVSFVKQPGTATVSGTATLKLADGTLKGCAGFNVELLPIAAYSSERIQKTYGNTRQGQILLEQNPPKFTPDVKAYHEMLLKSACDAKGQFRFEKVPAGEYFIMAFIIWDDASSGAPRKTGGAVMKRIRVGAYDIARHEAGAGQVDPYDDSVASLEAAYPGLAYLFDAEATLAYQPAGATVIKKTRMQLPKSHPLHVVDDLPADDVLLLETSLRGVGKVWVLFSLGASMDPSFYLVKQGGRGDARWAEIPATALGLPDDGTLFAATRANSHFTKRRRYQVTERGAAEIPRPFWYVGLMTRTLKPVDLYFTPTSDVVVATLATGAEIEVLTTDDKPNKQGSTSYFVRTSEGLTGWVWVPTSQYKSDTIEGITFWGD